MPNRLSGFVLVTCADWAYHVHHRKDEGGENSRIKQLVRLVRDHPDNLDHILPHILRVEAPALVVGDPFRRSAFIMLNPTVLRGAREIWVDGHSDCAGILAHYGGQYPRISQRTIQTELLQSGALDFANQLAINARRQTRVHLTYTQFGKPGEVQETLEVCSVLSTVPFD